MWSWRLVNCVVVKTAVKMWLEVFAMIGLEMEWSNVELESGEVHVGKNSCEDVAGKVLDMIGLEMERSNVELESGDVHVGKNSREDVWKNAGHRTRLNGAMWSWRVVKCVLVKTAVKMWLEK
jgi:hypothetical protein